jgi:photosystem II stability/assembly factor-like uncharacterized protein
MKNIFLYFYVVICIFSRINLLHAQWVPTNCPTTYAISSFVVSGTNLFAGTWGNGVYLSTDKGTSWNEVNSGLIDLQVNSLALMGTNLFAGTVSSGVFLSTDNGKSWTAVDSGLTNIMVYAFAVSDTNIFAGTYGGHVFKSTNNGTSWTVVDSGLTNASQTICALAVSPNRTGGMNLFAGAWGSEVLGTWGSQIFKSTNNGTNWTADSAGLTNTSVTAFTVCGNNIFSGTSWNDHGPGGVYLSTNDGTSWTSVSSGLPQDNYTRVLAFAVSPNGASGTNLFVGTYGHGVFLSTDNGASWNSTGLPNYTNILALTILPNGVGDTILFAGTHWGVWAHPFSKIIPTIALNKYTFGFYSIGANSQTDTLKITSSSLSPLIIDSIYTRTKWFAVASVHDTVAKGDNACLLVSFTPDTAHSALYADTIYIVSNSMYSPTKIPLTGNIVRTSVSQDNSAIPKSFGISQNYPNPFNPATIINYQLPVSSFVTLKVYDILGREVTSLINARKNAGYYDATFNGEHLPSGIYFYRLQAGTYNQTKKLVLLK